MKITWKSLKIIADDINQKVKGSYINALSVINSTDIIMSFSFYKEEKLFITLNHENPFASLTNYKSSISTTLGKDNDFLRKYVKDSLIEEVKTINDDRILYIKTKKNDEFYQKMELHLYIELYPHRSNLIITNEKDIILYATHYSALAKGRVIQKDMMYHPLEKKENLEDTKESFSLLDFKNEVKKYIDTSLVKKEKEKYNELYKLFKIKVKSLTKKLNVLEDEIQKAQDYQKDIDIGNELSIFYYQKEGLDDFIKERSEINYDTSLSLANNVEKYFKKAKKKKRTIEMNTIEKEKCSHEIDTFNNLLNIWPFLKEEELIELSKAYLKGGKNKKDNQEGKALSPSYIEVDGTIIAFGKNNKQNDYLTFKLAHKDYYFLHILNYPGSHIVIFSSHPTNKEIQIASEISLLLSNKESGEVSFSPIKDIKKGQFLGQVNMLSYQTFFIKEIKESTKELVKNSKRF